MYSPGVAAAILSGCLLASACTSFDGVRGGASNDEVDWSDIDGTRGAVLLAEGPAAAPPGLLAFCARMSSACQTGAGGGAAPLLGQAGFIEASFSPPQGRPAASDATPEEVFARLLEMRVHALAIAAPRAEISLTEQRWRELASINSLVNGAIIATTDIRRYGVAEYWAMPIAEHPDASTPPEGDCEDYALEKRARLIALGWDRSALTLAVADVPRAGVHALLVVQTDHGDFVLDNLHRDPQPMERLNYRWISRQSPRSMTEWATARLEPSAYAAPQRVLEASLSVDILGPQTGGLAARRLGHGL